MKIRRITNEQAIFILIFIIGLAARFYQLGSAPLSDTEATWALQALAVSRPELANSAAPLGSQPAYIMLTGALFALFGASNFMARFWPALAGALLVTAPYLLSRPGKPRLLGSQVALLLALGLAITPGLVVASRTAGSPMMALAFTFLALTLIVIYQPLLAGIASGLALLSGTAVISGGVSIAAAAGLNFLWLRFRNADSRPPDSEQPVSETAGPGSATPIQSQNFDWRIFAVSTGLTVLLIGTFFFLRPQGLAAWLNTIPDYLAGWRALPVIPATRLLAAVVIYQPVAVLFGLVGILRLIIRPSAEQNKTHVLLTIFLLITTSFFILVYPGRQVIDAVWILAPLLMLASWELAHYIPRKSVHVISFVNAALIVVLLGLLWYTMTSLTRLPVTGMEGFARLIVIAGIIGLGALATVMVSMGWSWDAARLGLVGGLVIGLGLYSISALSSAAYLRQNQPQELWGATPAPGKVDLLQKTLEELSVWQTGTKDSLDIVSQFDTPSLRWLLNSFPNARFSSNPSAADMPSIVITSQFDETPALSAAYRGQEFVWWVFPGWNGAIPQEIIPWLTFRSAPLSQEKIIVWARSDLFPGDLLSQPGAPGEGPAEQSEPIEDPKAEQRDEDPR